MRTAVIAVMIALGLGVFSASGDSFAEAGCDPGFVPHPYVLDECYPAYGSACVDGGYCQAGEICTADGGCSPAGAVQCSDGGYCNAGELCGSGGGCVPLGAMDCGDGSYCPGGSYCVAGGCEYY